MRGTDRLHAIPSNYGTAIAASRKIATMPPPRWRRQEGPVAARRRLQSTCTICQGSAFRCSPRSAAPRFSWPPAQLGRRPRLARSICDASRVPGTHQQRRSVRVGSSRPPHSAQRLEQQQQAWWSGSGWRGSAARCASQVARSAQRRRRRRPLPPPLLPAAAPVPSPLLPSDDGVPPSASHRCAAAQSYAVPPPHPATCSVSPHAAPALLPHLCRRRAVPARRAPPRAAGPL